MQEDNLFLDSNILVYSISVDEPDKRSIARKLLKTNFFISSQVVFEFINVAVHKFRFSKIEAMRYAETFLKNSQFISEEKETVDIAFKILKRNELQVFDSKIIASALLAGCSVLYSEDLQHGQVFEKKLKVVNPFLIAKTK